MRAVRLVAVVLAGGIMAQDASAFDCFDAAGVYQGVRAGILRAIAIRENARCDGTVHLNQNGTTDTGCMQINSIHYGELAKHGVKPSDLKDQCKNIFIGAWHYRVMVIRYGNTWDAVGAYHSESVPLRDQYAREVKRIYERYRSVIDPD